MLLGIMRLILLLLVASRWILTLALASSPDPSAPVVVSGGGPASLMFAARYLQLNPFAKVEIYEKRARPRLKASHRFEEDTGFLAFGFGLGGRAQGQIDKIPGMLDKVASVAQKSRLWFVSHRDLCCQMIDHLESIHGIDGKGRLKINFECSVEHVNDDFTVEVSEGSVTKSAPYSLLVASDGINSVIRQRMVEQGEISCVRYRRNVGWKALPLPPQENKIQSKVYRLKGNFGGLLPRYPDRNVILMFWNKSRRSAQTTPFNVSTPQELRTKILEQFPDISDFPSEEQMRFFLDQEPRIETYMKLDKHAVPSKRLAIIGDAAAGMYSHLGQGVASAMERASLLAETMNDDEKAEEALKTFSQTSVKEAHAITDLNLIAHFGETPIGRKFPPISKVRPIINDPTVPYSSILKQNRRNVLAGRFLWYFLRVPSISP
mmetsp:Transcript_76/g.341  ORF Transcript_76/g.341 Transcript_76/m.341 type:complete len:434 (-) Transcript_76:6-1307(-)